MPFPFLKTLYWRPDSRVMTPGLSLFSDKNERPASLVPAIARVAFETKKNTSAMSCSIENSIVSRRLFLGNDVVVVVVVVAAAAAAAVVVAVAVAVVVVVSCARKIL